MQEEESIYPSGHMDLPGEPTVTPEPNKKGGFSKKRVVMIAVAVVLLAGVGFTYALLTNKDTDKTADSDNQSPPAQTTNTNTTSTTTDIPTTTITKEYKSDFPRIKFTYPENWQVTADSQSAGVRIESPTFTYKTINGNSVDGVFRIYIRQGSRQVDSTYIGRGIAMQTSETLTYEDPAPGQRPETNLSFFGLDTADNFAYYMIAGNFLLQKGESLGPEYGREPETYIIVGGYSSQELTDDIAMNQVPTTEFSQTNAYKQSLEIVKSLQLL